jgi:hypothetical protein
MANSSGLYVRNHSDFIWMRLLIFLFYATMLALRFWRERKRDTLPQSESKKAGIRIETALLATLLRELF